jgi:hypothetical protein
MVTKRQRLRLTSKGRDFVDAEVFNKRGLKKKISTTGYEAFRVSSRTTEKHGLKLKKIWGATVEPDYSRGKRGKWGAKVGWYPHGYTDASVKGGTRNIGFNKFYPVDQQEAKRKLMLKPRKRIVKMVKSIKK